MAYDVLTFTLTDYEIAKGDLARDGDLRLCPPGFAADLPIETHNFPAERRQIWLQRLEPATLCKRIERIILDYEKKGGQKIESMRCPHTDEPLHPGYLMYLAVRLLFCRDCMMLMQGASVDYERPYISVCNGDGRRRHVRMKSEYEHWLETRKINWVHCGDPVVLDPYKRQMGF